MDPFDRIFHDPAVQREIVAELLERTRFTTDVPLLFCRIPVLVTKHAPTDAVALTDRQSPPAAPAPG